DDSPRRPAPGRRTGHPSPGGGRPHPPRRPGRRAPRAAGRTARCRPPGARHPAGGPRGARTHTHMNDATITTPVTADLLRGHVELEETPDGVLPHRLPAWARAQT